MKTYLHVVRAPKVGLDAAGWFVGDLDASLEYANWEI